MLIKLGRAYDLLKNIIYGIQGGKGSFNEEAILFLYQKIRLIILK